MLANPERTSHDATKSGASGASRCYRKWSLWRTEEEITQAELPER